MFRVIYTTKYIWIKTQPFMIASRESAIVSIKLLHFHTDKILIAFFIFFVSAKLFASTMFAYLPKHFVKNFDKHFIFTDA